MILQRLYDLAVREQLLDDPAFEELPVPYLVLVGNDGEYLGFNDIRGENTIPSKKKGGAPRRVKDKGRLLTVPCAHRNKANQGFARYFVDTLPRVLPLVVDPKDQKKVDASRATFWRQIDQAADATDDPALRAVQAFGRRIDEWTNRIREDVKALAQKLTDRVTFGYLGSGGATLLDLEPVRRWFATLYSELNARKQVDGPTGLCQVTGTVSPIPITHPRKLQGIPDGKSVGVSLISFDKAAFGHYGLDGAENAAIGYQAAEGYLRALEALLKDSLPSAKAKGAKSRLVIGRTAFLYWTKDPTEAAFVSEIDSPTDEGRKKLPKPRIRGTAEKVFQASWDGKREAASTVTDEWFHVLALSSNSARAIVRGYLETPLPEAKQNVADWFADLRIADTSKDYSGTPNDRFPLWKLVLATACDKDSVSADTSERLLTAALTGSPVPESLLAQCLKRLLAEGSKGFYASRMALIKLILLRRNISMTEQLNPDEQHPAYVYGRLLAVFEQIQYAALGDVNANVVDKFYGTMSSAPAMVVGRLQDNARNHLRKLRGEKPAACVALEKRMMEILGLLPAAPPPSRLSLQDQGRFALGYYHEKARRFEEIAERQAEKAKAETN